MAQAHVRQSIHRYTSHRHIDTPPLNTHPQQNPRDLSHYCSLFPHTLPRRSNKNDHYHKLLPSISRWSVILSHPHLPQHAHNDCPHVTHTPHQHPARNTLSSTHDPHPVHHLTTHLSTTPHAAHHLFEKSTRPVSPVHTAPSSPLCLQSERSRVCVSQPGTHIARTRHRLFPSRSRSLGQIHKVTVCGGQVRS